MNLIAIFCKYSVIILPFLIFIKYLISVKTFWLIFWILIHINYIINGILKHICGKWKDNIFSRPNLTIDILNKCSLCKLKTNNFIKHHKKIGMPSGHSQFIWFFCVFLSIYYYQKHQYLYIVLLLILAILVSISRLGILNLGDRCHTQLQILIGAIIGIILAFTSFYLIKIEN